jgi:non-homologous end joining protein Ku
LRLSLVSCPIYLSPATTRTKSIRLHQVWRPAPAPDADEPDRDRDEAAPAGSRLQPMDPGAAERADRASTATRIALRPHDPTTGEAIDKSEIVRGYEYDRGQFVTFTADELKALDAESSKVVDLETFVPHGDIDPVYRDSPYYLYPDGAIAVATLRVISAAMTASGVAGIGRLTLSRRERMVTVEPRGPNDAVHVARRRRGSGAAVWRQRGRS